MRLHHRADLPPVAASSAEQKIIAALEAIRPRPSITPELIRALDLDAAPDMNTLRQALTVYAARRLWAASAKRSIVAQLIREGADEYGATRTANALLLKLMNDCNTAPGGSLHTTERN
jgi:hypothetical protein